MGSHDYRSPPRFEKNQGVLLKRNVLPSTIAAATGLSAIALAFYFQGERRVANEWMPAFSITICVSWLATFLFWSTYAFAWTRRGALRIDALGIHLDGSLEISASEIESASFAMLAWRHPVVRIALRNSLFLRHLRVVDESEAGAMIAALGFDAAHHRASFVLPWRPFQWGVWLIFYMLLWVIVPLSLVLGLFVSHGHTPLIDGTDFTILGATLAIFFGASLIYGYWFLYLRSRLHVTFGPDGIETAQWGRSRLILWSDVRVIETWLGAMTRGGRSAPQGFDLILASGERIGFTTARERMRAGIFGGDIVATALLEAMQTSPTGRGAEVVQRAITR